MRDHRGELNPRAKLSAEQVKEIREGKRWYTAGSLSETYGVSKVLIYKIWSGERWKE